MNYVPMDLQLGGMSSTALFLQWGIEEIILYAILMRYLYMKESAPPRMKKP
jgi:hypothetical protein